MKNMTEKPDNKSKTNSVLEHVLDDKLYSTGGIRLLSDNQNKLLKKD